LRLRNCIVKDYQRIPRENYIERGWDLETEKPKPEKLDESISLLILDYRFSKPGVG